METKQRLDLRYVVCPIDLSGEFESSLQYATAIARVHERITIRRLQPNPLRDRFGALVRERHPAGCIARMGDRRTPDLRVRG